VNSREPAREPLRLPPPLDFSPHWWGPIGRRSTPLTIQELISNRTIDVGLAAWLWLLIEHGASLLVCAGPGGAGKTTLLTALTAFLAPHRAPYVVRGAYDPLDAIAGKPAAETALLVNEISAHLPIYLWGAAARRVFDASQAGAQVLATAHATSPGEAMRELASPPINANADDLRRWDLVLFIDAWRQGHRIERQVTDVVSFSLDTRMIAGSAASRRLETAQLQRLARRLGCPGGTIDQEVERRRTALCLAP
jgi:energy-coupling factor transporter ATP-binding protein EcfA2